MEKKQNKPIRWILQKIRSRIPALILLTVLHMAGAVCGVWFALGSRNVIDTATGGNKDAFLTACLIQGSIILGILVISTVTLHLKERLMADLDRDWKRKLLHTLLHGEYTAVSGYHTGELLNRMNNDVRVLNSSVLSILPGVTAMVTRLISALAVLITLEPTLTAVVIAGGIVVVLATGFLRRRLKGLHKRAAREEGRVSGFLQETLEKLLAVQAMDIADEMERRAEGLLEIRYQIQRKRKNISVTASTCVSILSYGAAFGALIWCAGGFLDPASGMTFGVMTAVSQLVGQLQGPFVNLSAIAPQYIAMTAAAERLMELEEVGDTSVTEKQDAAKLYEAMTGIRAQKLTFAYDRDVVFADASFTLPKDTFGVIVGQSGIGKSTLLKLLLGIYPEHTGQLLVQTEEAAIPVDRSTQGLFAYVPQGNLLLSGSLRENLVITKPDATEEEIAHAVWVSAMDEYLPSLPKGLDTVVGENAQGLSEGQAQRLSIARAILSNAPILLLDEATSALDAETEQVVLSRIRSLKGKTCIAVTHRAAATELADWTLEVKDGKCAVTT